MITQYVCHLKLYYCCRHCAGELPDNFEEIFHSVDVDNSAEINYNEFVAAAMCQRITIDEEKLMLAFPCHSLISLLKTQPENLSKPCHRSRFFWHLLASRCKSFSPRFATT